MASLTDRQRDELHRAIAAYLQSRGYDRSLGAFKEEAQVSTEVAAAPDQNGAVVDTGKPLTNGIAALAADAKRLDHLLERKWTSVVRLQKKVMDLELQLAQMRAAQPAYQSHSTVPSAANATNGTTKAISWAPQAPAQTTLAGHRLPVAALAFHPVHTVLATGSDDTTIKLWDWKSGELVRSLAGHAKSVTSVDFSPPGAGSASLGSAVDGVLLASASTDTTIKLYDASQDYRQVRTLYGHDHIVSSVRFCPNPARWRSKAANAPAVLAAASPQLLVSCSRDGSVRVWDVRTGACLGAVRGAHGGSGDVWIRACEPSPDGSLLLTGGHDTTARVFDLIDIVTRTHATASFGGGAVAARTELAGHEHVVEAVAWAPATAYARLAQLHAQTSAASAHGGWQVAELGPESRFCATASRDRRIGIWDVTATAANLAWLCGHDGWVRSLEFAPDGAWLFSAGDDRTIRCWDLSLASDDPSNGRTSSLPNTKVTSGTDTPESGAPMAYAGAREIACTRIVQAHSAFVTQIRWAHTPASLRDARRSQRAVGLQQRRARRALADASIASINSGRGGRDAGGGGGGGGDNSPALLSGLAEQDDEEVGGDDGSDRRRLTMLGSCGLDKVAKIWSPT